MTKLRQQDVKTFKQLEKFAAPYGYKTNHRGKLRQQSWRGLAFDTDGRVVYLKNGGVICERSMSFANCAALIDIIGDIDKFDKLKAEVKELRTLKRDIKEIKKETETIKQQLQIARDMFEVIKTMQWGELKDCKKYAEKALAKIKEIK